MSFKDQIKKDIGAVFFNAEEFSEVHSIDGKEVRAIIDNMELLEREKAKGKEHNDGLYKSEILVYVPVEDYGARPAIGKTIIMDGKKRYKITDVVEENGIYSLTLEIYKV